MKTLKITSQDQINALPLGNTYHKERLINTLNIQTEVLKYHPCTFIAYFPEYENKVYLDNTNLSLGGGIYISKDYNGQYRIGLHHVWRRKHLKNINYSLEEDLLKDLKKPQNFKVLNAKRINDWVNYWKAAKNVLTHKEKEIEAKRIDFLANLNEKAKKNNWIIRSNCSGNTCYIDAGLFTYSYELSNSCISQNLRFNDYNVSDKLAAFEALSKITT